MPDIQNIQPWEIPPPERGQQRFYVHRMGRGENIHEVVNIIVTKINEIIMRVNPVLDPPVAIPVQQGSGGGKRTRRNRKKRKKTRRRRKRRKKNNKRN
jgi:hypothetical protein